jgi:hypothetical protein
MDNPPVVFQLNIDFCPSAALTDLSPSRAIFSQVLGADPSHTPIHLDPNIRGEN